MVDQQYLTKSRIRKIGDRIRNTYPIMNADDLEAIEDFRMSFKGAINRTYSELFKISSSIYKNCVLTYRIKRFESIISKLNRFTSMKLDRMGDIAGCRCIVNSTKQVYLIREEIYRFFNVKHENDYIKNPQDDGYRSLHIYIECKDSKKTVEIQLRTKEQHSWATLVEITDLIYDEELKEKKGNRELRKLLKFLSNDQIGLSDKNEIIQIISEFKFFEKLSSVFTMNYIPLRKQWISSERKGGTYFIIEASKDAIPKIDSYKSFDQAEEVYFRRYKDESNINRVLTHISKPSYKKISLAYSNYILTYHDFVKRIFNIIEELILESLSKRQYRKNTLYYDFYLSQIFIHQKNLRQELAVSRENMQRKLTREWEIDIKNQIKDFEKRRQKLISNIGTISVFNPFAIQYLRARYTAINLKFKIKVEKLQYNQ